MRTDFGEERGFRTLVAPDMKRSELRARGRASLKVPLVMGTTENGRTDWLAAYAQRSEPLASLV